MSKRSKRAVQEETPFKYELHQPSKRRLQTNSSEETCAYPIPLPFMDDITDIFGDKQIRSQSESINLGAENLFTDSESEKISTIPLPTSPNKPSTSSAFIFPDSPGTPENVSVLTDTESPSSSETEDELASVSSCQSEGTPKTQKRTNTRSDYYRERLNQLEREQQDRRERWKKKLEIMEKLLNK